MNNIHFPMKSNINFFEKKSNQPPLIDKIKQSILMYDTLYFDVGAYRLSCGDNGSFANYFPPDQISDLELDVPELTQTGFYVTMKAEPNGQPFTPIRPSKNSKTYTVCFQKLLEDMSLSDENFIKLGLFVLPESGKKQLKDQLWEKKNIKNTLMDLNSVKIEFMKISLNH